MRVIFVKRDTVHLPFSYGLPFQCNSDIEASIDCLNYTWICIKEVKAIERTNGYWVAVDCNEMW